MFLAGAAERQQGGRARHQVGQDGVRIGLGGAVGGDDPAPGHFFVHLGVNLDLAALDDGGGAVEQERKLVAGGQGEGQRVGAEHVLNAEGGGDGRAGVGAAEADHAGLGGHEGVVAGDAEMGGVADGDHAEAVLFRFLDGEGHGLVGGHVAHAVAAVQHGGSSAAAEGADAGDRELDARADAVVVDGFEA